jgi:membrane protein implicated in regulation of membrane protease activity
VELIQSIEQFAWIGWIVLILVFFTIETLTLEMTFLMLGLGGVAGLVADLAGAPLWGQVIIAAAVAALLLFVLRPPLLRRLRRGEDPARSNIDALRGMRGVVVSTVGPMGGQVRLANGDIWTARTATSIDITPGITISVTHIDGATAFVEADADPRESTQAIQEDFPS